MTILSATQINLFFRTSRFDESLVRLRRRLCWSLLDVLHLEHPADPMGSTDLQGSTAFQKVRLDEAGGVSMKIWFD